MPIPLHWYHSSFIISPSMMKHLFEHLEAAASEAEQDKQQDHFHP